MTHLNAHHGKRNATHHSELSQIMPSLPSTQHLRFQLFLEYGVDVDTVRFQQMATAEGSERDTSIRSYWLETLMPQDVTEDEFLRQMASPSGMAQTCCVMLATTQRTKMNAAGTKMNAAGTKMNAAGTKMNAAGNSRRAHFAG
jgi:hypothetical protein